MSTTNDTADVQWLPAQVVACYECGVYYEAGDGTNYCRECGEELWQLEKA